MFFYDRQEELRPRDFNYYVEFLRRQRREIGWYVKVHYIRGLQGARERKLPCADVLRG